MQTHLLSIHIHTRAQNTSFALPKYHYSIINPLKWSPDNHTWALTRQRFNIVQWTFSRLYTTSINPNIFKIGMLKSLMNSRWITIIIERSPKQIMIWRRHDVYRNRIMVHEIVSYTTCQGLIPTNHITFSWYSQRKQKGKGILHIYIYKNVADRSVIPSQETRFILI